MYNDIVYFELNNWFSGRDYPIGEPFKSWMGNDLKQQFRNESWVKENKLVVVISPIDMSTNYNITAPRKWIEENCPKLLSDETYSYDVHMYLGGEEKIVTEYRSYSDFLRYIEEGYDLPVGRWGTHFKEYTEENIGIHWEYPDEDDDYYEEDEDEES